eukprot:1838431-Pleurochrysis_carterae.AAC.4
MTKPNIICLQAKNLYCSTVVKLTASSRFYSFQRESAVCVVKRAAVIFYRLLVGDGCPESQDGKIALPRACCGLRQYFVIWLQLYVNHLSLP